MSPVDLNSIGNASVAGVALWYIGQGIYNSARGNKGSTKISGEVAVALARQTQILEGIHELLGKSTDEQRRHAMETTEKLARIDAKLPSGGIAVVRG